MKFNILHADGETHAVDVNLALMGEARDAKAKHPLAVLDARCDTGVDKPTARQQIYEQMGFGDGATLAQALDSKLFKGPSANMASTDDGAITGRLVTQAYLFDAIESSMRENDYGLGQIFTRKAAAVDSINNTEFTRPILNYTRPASAKPRPIAQLSEPTRMLLLTASERSMAIPGESIGLEYSDQVAQRTSLDIVTLSMNRMAEETAAARIEDRLLSFLNGDSDSGMVPLSAVSNAVVAAETLDPTITAAGVLSQKAWVYWLFRKNRICKIDTVVTDLAGALAIENRVGRPLVNDNFGTSKRIDTLESIINPTWPDKVDVIITQDSRWPANTIMGFDSRYGYHLVNSTVLDYQAMEQLAIRRSTRLRVDQGSLAYRLHDDVWQVLTLTV